MTASTIAIAPNITEYFQEVISDAIRARQVELGITEAVWRHSGAGKKPRPKHVAASGKRYDVAKGMKIGDKGQWVLPGEEINCRCTSESILPGIAPLKGA